MNNRLWKRCLPFTLCAALAVGWLTYQMLATVAHAQELQQSHSLNDAFERAKKQECVAGALAGRFSYIFDGSIVGVGATKAVGLLTVSADGTLSFQDTQSVAGQIVRRTFTGTYQLKPDCTATAQFSTGTSADLIVDNDGNGLKIIITTPGVIITGIGQRIFNL